MMGRIIITGSPQAQPLETLLRLGVPDSLEDRVKTQAATNVGYAGSSLVPSRGDHRHAAYVLNTIQDVSFATSTAGVSDAFARGDHVHFGVPGAITYGAYASNVSWSTSTGGAAVTASRADHQHRFLPGVRVDATGIRTTSATYTNNGSGPMWIGISLALSSPGVFGAHLQIGGVNVAHAKGAADTHFFIMGIANAGEQYLLTASGGANIDHWIEYGF